jgi:hypothetical protein
LKFDAKKSGSLLDTPPMFNLFAKIDEIETIPVFVLTNQAESLLIPGLPKPPSFMKHIKGTNPNLTDLTQVIRALFEAFPEKPVDKIMNYVNSWSGICGKLSDQVK